MKSPAENSVPVVLSIALVPLMLMKQPATVPLPVIANACAAVGALVRDPVPVPLAAFQLVGLSFEGVFRLGL